MSLCIFTGMEIQWQQPLEGEFIPYQSLYLEKVPTGNLVHILEQSLAETIATLLPLTNEQAEYAYAPGKWTIKQVLIHLNDCERILAYRALCIARGEQNPLPGFEQDDYVLAANVSERSLSDLLAEFQSIRAATLTLINSFNQEILNRKGNANKHPITVNALCFVIAGHELHHMSIIREKYL
jgi:hypothetical protein